MPGKGRVRLVDVAREAGTSVSTASRAMNRSPVISPEIADHVRAVAGRLGYRADRTAQEFKTGRVRTVGVTVPDLANPVFPEVLKGLGAAARAAGHRLLIGESCEDPAEELRLTEELADHSGALVLCSSRLSTSALDKVLGLPVPIVSINRVVKNAGVVSIDFAAGSRQLLEHLGGLGHRRIAYVGGPPASWSHRQRTRALRPLASARGIELVELPGGWSGDHGYAAGSAVLAAEVTAVITFNDLVAIGLLSWLHDRGVEVPESLSLASYDDIPIAAHTRPPLTALRNQRATLGRLAWEQLMAQFDGADPSEPILVPTSLVVRSSTASPPGRRRTS